MMSDRPSFDVDAALGALAREVRAASPKPDDALRARVLEDAARFRPAPERPAPVRSRQPAASTGVLGWLFGWSGGVAVTMALSLMVGVAVGMEVDLSVTTDDPAAAALDGEDFALLDLDLG